MARYHYTVRRPETSKTEKGVMEAETMAEVISKLHQEKAIILGVEPASKLAFEFKFFHKKVTLKDKLIFTRQLSVMIKAGLPITRALEALSRQTQNKYFQGVLAQIIELVRGGQTLSKAMTRYSAIFPEIYVAVIRAGEESGQLAEVLKNLADQQEKDADLIGKIKGAMIYPAVILVTLIGVAGLIVFFVLPSLKGIFESSGQQLPFLTRLLLGTSDFLRHYLLILMPILVALYYLLHQYIATSQGTRVYDKLRLHLPIFGDLTKKLYMARFTRTMAMLVHASLPILQSLKIVEQTISNVHYREAFSRISKAVESGHTFSSALLHEELFPPMVGQLASLGEETGNIEGTLLEAARFYDTEVDTISKNLATLLEPLMILLMGVGVGFTVAAVLGPIYGLVQNFGG